MIISEKNIEIEWIEEKRFILKTRGGKQRNT